MRPSGFSRDFWIGATIRYGLALGLLAGWFVLIANWPIFQAHTGHWSGWLAVILLVASVIAVASVSLWEPLSTSDPHMCIDC